MKSLLLAILAAGAVCLPAQTPAPSKPGTLFQLPPALSGQSPRFKLHMPMWGLQPQTPELDTHIDQAMVMNPPDASLTEHPARPAIPQQLYPGLQILPAETAGLGPLPTLWPNARVIPIPITWPHAKVIPIPTGTGGFTAFRVRSSAAPARK